jgi:hypothetical protein
VCQEVYSVVTVIVYPQNLRAGISPAGGHAGVLIVLIDLQQWTKFTYLFIFLLMH